ncbi:MAG TPA: hypothetical protein VM425_13655 [Myxococcota bacterium]|nr:hypothetical protein [Myxococcota bacterium]
MKASLATTATLMFLACACSQPHKPKLPADKSGLKTATDVFWALDKHGYAIAKEKPLASKHGCKPSEYLAKKGEALFRISVFHCGDAEQARALVENPKTRHVDALLRNPGEGGILRRGPLEIIVRMTKGKKEDVAALLDFLGSL